MTRAERDELRARFEFRCGYCGVSETDAGALLTVDHFHPQSQHGADDASNWVLCCSACNSFKGAYWPATSASLPLLNPLTDDFPLHLELRDNLMVGLSPRGRNHIEVLHLNREPLVTHRRDVEEHRRNERRLQEALELAERERRGRERAEEELERWRKQVEFNL